MDQNEFNRQFQQYMQSWIQEQGMSRMSRMHAGRVDTHRSKAEREQTYDTLPQKKFNWFTYQQIQKMDDHPFEEGCPVQLNPITKEEMFQSPLMRQVFHLMNTLAQKDLRLTSNGYLPVTMVEELYELGTREQYRRYLEKFSESYLYEVRLVHKVLQETGLISKTSSKMSLTEKGKTLLGDHNLLLRNILTYLFKDFDTVEMFSIGDAQCGNTGRLYSLWLLHHFGVSWHGLRFYEKEYFKAFPFELDKSIYSRRIFEHLFTYLGFCDKSTKYLELGTKKSPLVDIMFSFEEPVKPAKT